MDVAEISKRQLSFRDGPLEKLWGGGEGNFRAVVSNGPSLTSRVICLYTDAAKPKLAISVESELLSSAIPKSQDHFDHQRLLWPDFST